MHNASIMLWPPPPELLGWLALAAGVMAVISAVYATHHERSEHSRLPLHHIKIEVDDAATQVFGLHSGASSAAELATAIRRILTGNVS